MIHFETDKKPLTFLLDQIENRDLALPDFQRSFVWDPNATRELVVSIIRSFPAGTLLQMEGGGKVFAAREFEGAPDLNGNPAHLILDGQQRMTSLYQAFSGVGTHRFFLNIQEVLDGLSLDEAVEVYTRKRAQRWSKLASQSVDLMLPLSSIRVFSDWRDDVLDYRADRGEEVKKLRKELNDVEKECIDPIKLYNFPVTTLSSTTPVEAVCTIFETLNRTGVKLSVFELITARAFARRVRLRVMWEEAKQAYPVLEDFGVNPYYILQTIAVSVKKSPKRSIVLNLDVDDIVDNWEEAVKGLAQSLELLRDECGVLVSKWIPYETMLITMASAWRAILASSGPAVGARRAKMARWFWCSSFAQSYENSGNTMTERDVPELMTWLNGGETPPLVEAFRFGSNRWREVTVRQRALYRATMALMMRQAPLDFHNANPLSKPVIDGQSVDDHHVFPRSFLKSKGKAKLIDNVLNHTLIDRITNIRIGGRAPSKYLLEMEQELGPKLRSILESHGLPPEKDGPLFRDDYELFLDWRQRHLEKELAEVTGGEVAPDLTPIEVNLLKGADSEPSKTDVTFADRAQVAAFLDRFDLASTRHLVDSFIEKVSSWSDVRVWIGQSQYEQRRRLFFSRQGSAYGAFCWFHPHFSRIRFRLDTEDGIGLDGVELLDVKNPYKLKTVLDDPKVLERSVELAQLAYERAVS